MSKRLLAITALTAVFLCPALADPDVYIADHGTDSYFIPCFPLRSISSDGAAFATGITGATSGFTVHIKGDNEATYTEFETTADIESGQTIGTYSAPTAATDVVFDECQSTGTYQMSIHNDYLDTSGATELEIILEDGGTAIGSQFIRIDLNRLSAADIQQEAEDAISSQLILGSGTCDAGADSTSCPDATNRTESDDDYWKGQLFCPTSGDAVSQCVQITAFTASSDTLTFDATTAAVAENDTYVIRAGPAGVRAEVDDLAASQLAAFLNCEVNTANFAGSSTTLACILTDLDGSAVTQATGDLEGLQIVVTSGAQIREARFINDTTWDAGNSELQLTLSRALPATLADAVTAVIR